MRWFTWGPKLGLLAALVLVGVVFTSLFGGAAEQRVTAPARQTTAFPMRNAVDFTDARGPATKGTPAAPFGKPHHLVLTRAHSAVFNVKNLKSIVTRRERPEHEGLGPIGGDEDEDAAFADPDADMPASLAQDQMVQKSAPTSSTPKFAAPAPAITFDGLDYLNWGQGHPPDVNGDVGPTYYIQTVNTSIGIYNKSSGARVAAFTFDTFMSQGNFTGTASLCNNANFGDPVVLYDTYEDRWFITDFAFTLDGSNNISPQHVMQCFAVSKTGDPVNGGWNFYSFENAGGIDDYPKFGIWPDGIYMGANTFDYAAAATFKNPRVWAINKQQMYAGAPTVDVASFDAPAAEFTLLPANSRLQEGAPPVGAPNYFAVVWQFLNQVSVYKFHVDWDKISTSTFTGPFASTDTFWWEQWSGTTAATPANGNDTLYPRLMMQNQYTNIGGVESLWDSHSVGAGNPTSNLTSAQAAVRYYQVNVTGGNVGANTTQSFTYSPDTTIQRYMPSVAADRLGDMAIGYTTSSSTLFPAVKYAGRLAGDAANTITQSEQTLFQGTGAQSGTCGGSTCTRWGDYSAMTVDPDGCNFWYTNEYYNTPNSLNDLTRIGEFKLNPSCTAVGNGTLSGTVTSAGNPVSGATVKLGSRTTTTNGSGQYSFTIPAGTYPSLTADSPGNTQASASGLAVPNGGTLTQNFTLTAASQSGCFTDSTQATFQRGVTTNCDLATNIDKVQLTQPVTLDQSNSTVTSNGFGFTNVSWAGQTFTPSVTGKVASVAVELFCSSCSGTNPDITVSIRATTGATPVPTGADLATGTIPGFSTDGFFTVNFATQPTLTAGTRYAIVFRATAARTGTYAYVCSCRGGTPPTGADTSPYANGQRVTSSNSGSSWAADTTSGGRDIQFATYMNLGYSSAGTYVSSLKDANPAAGSTANWTTLTYSKNEPSGTSVQFQVAGSSSPYGPWNFVGPNGTASTFFSSGDSLSQFNGFRYLKYEALLSTSNSANTPTVSSVQVCFNDVVGSAATTTLTPASASGTYGGTTTLTATLTSAGNGVSGKTVSFTLNGSSVGGATTNASGVATLNSVSLSGINAGSYPTGVGASFAGDASYLTSSGTSSLTVSQASQAIVITTHAPSSAAFNSQFTVAATGGGSGNAVTYGSSGSCTNSGATFTITVSSGTCTVTYNQAGNTNYSAAPQLTESVNGTKANQTITITTHAPANATYGTQFTVAATGGASGNAVTFGASGACTNSGATFTMTSGTGTCTVTYDQAGNTNYNAATQQTESVTAQKANQTITVTTHAPASAAYNSQFTVAASAPSGAVSYSSSGVCTNSGATYTMTSGTGTCSAVYNRAGDSNYNAATQVTENVTATKINQSITFLTPADRTYGDADFDPGATASSGFAVTYSASGNCSIVSGNVHITGAGSCTVSANQAGDSNYNAAPQVQRTFSIAKANQTITITTSAPATGVYGTGFTVAATGGGSGNAVTFGSSGACTNTGASFTMSSGTGTCTVTYNQAGNANYNAAPQQSESVTAQKANQAILIGTHAPASAVYGTGFTVAATGGGSANAIVYGSTGGCSNTGAAFTMTSGSSDCTVTYNQAGDSNYNAAPQQSETVTAQKANQAILIGTHAPASAVYGTGFTVAATGGGSGNAIVYGSSGGCSHTGAAFTMTSGSSDCTVTYNQAGDSNYNAAPQQSETVTAQKANQTITVTLDAPSTAVYNTSFDVDANAPGGTVLIQSSGVCSNIGPTFTMTSGTGTCTVTFDQSGNSNYNPATQVSQSVTAQKAAQAIQIGTHAPASAVYGTDFSVAATGGDSGNSVTYGSSGACSNTGANFTMTSGTGTCTVTYDQAGDFNYDDATQASDTVTAQKANQSILITQHAPSDAVVNDQFTVSATGGGSGNPIVYGSSGACTHTGATYTITGTGACAVKYDQAGNSNYNAAPELTEAVNSSKADQTIHVSTHAPSSAAYGTGFTVSATGGGSGNAVTYGSLGACTNSGATFTMTSGTGTCTVTYNQAGNSSYDAATQVSESVTAQKASQSITVVPRGSASAVYGTSFSVSASAGSGNAVAYGSSGACSNAGSLYTMTSGTGTCTITYDQLGDSNYGPAPEVTEFVTAEKAGQAITVGTHAPSTAVYGSHFTVAATGGGSGNAIVYGASGVCTSSDAVYRITGVGTCTVTYNQTGDSNYNAAPQLTDTVKVKSKQLNAGRTSCNGTYYGTGRSVVVPAGATCGLVPGTRLTLNVTVKSGGTLYMTGVKVGGNLTIAGTATVCNSKMAKDVNATGGSIALGGPSCAGNRVAGNVFVTSDANDVWVWNNTVKGGLTVNLLTGATELIDGNVVFGDLYVGNSGPPVDISLNSATNARCPNNSGQTGSGNTTTGTTNTCPH